MDENNGSETRYLLGPILLFDLDEAWTKRAEQIFLRRSIQADIITTDFDMCFKKAEEKVYEVLVVNVHALEKPRDDLRRFNRDFSGIDILIFGDHDDPNIQEYLWPPEQLAADYFGDKNTMEISKLGSMVEEIIRRRHRLPGQIEVELHPEVDDILDQFSKTRTQTRSGVRRERLETSLKRMKDELKIVVGHLFVDRIRKEPIARKVSITPFAKAGRSSACILEVTPEIILDDKRRKSAVLKFGPKKDIRDESYNYDFYVQWFLTVRQTVQKIGYAEASKYSGILYSYPSDNPDVALSFADYMRKNPTEKSLDILHKMFNTDNQQWLSVDGNRFVDIDFPVFQTYYLQEVLHSSIHDMRTVHLASVMEQVDKLRDTINRRIVSFYDDSITFKDLSLTLPNPVQWLSVGIADEVKLTLIHGDLHALNILVDEKEDRYYFIDFFYTGFGDIFRDFIELEISVRYDIFCSRSVPDDRRMTCRDSKNTDAEGLRKLHRLEKAIIKSTIHKKVPREPLLKENEDMKKAFDIISAIREYAFANYEKKYGPESLARYSYLYYLGLAASSLKHLKYFIPLDVKLYRLMIAGLYIDAYNKGHLNN